MIICLKTATKQDYPIRVQLNLTERLPHQIISDCSLVCEYVVSRYPDYYVLTLDVTGELPMQCQRCLGEFAQPYKNHTTLAICTNESTAEKLMESYECIVSPQLEVNLNEIVTDELHLYAPEKHEELIDCTDKILN
jgi:uncharacterized protein